MTSPHRKALVYGVLAATALAMNLLAVAQAPTPPPAATATPAPPAGGHHKHHAGKADRSADMKAECQAMMARKQEMEQKLQAMDATLDRLVAEMNAARGSKEPDALERPTVAVINELVAERKASRALMMEMQPTMMAHVMHHMRLHGGKGAEQCPMMAGGKLPGPLPEKK